MASVQVARLLRLLTLLRARTARNAKALAAELEITERTVYRDLNTLALAGVPYRFDKGDGGYRIDGDFFLPPTQLTLGEAMALSVLASQLAGRGQVPFSGGGVAGSHQDPVAASCRDPGGGCRWRWARAH